MNTTQRLRAPRHMAPLALAAILLATACTTPVKIRNVAPRVTHIGAAVPIEGGLRVLYWLQDHEGDPVDLQAGYGVGAAVCDQLRRRLAESDGAPRSPAREELEPLLTLPGNSHHLSGVAGGSEFPGKARLLDWAHPDTLAPDEVVCLYLIPDDRKGRLGDPALSPNFPAGEGFGDLHVPPPRADEPPTADVFSPETTDSTTERGGG